LRNTAFEYYLTCITDAGVTAYYNNVAKLATTATGADISGTVTADGLVVDGAGDGVKASIGKTGGTNLNIYADTNTVYLAGSASLSNAYILDQTNNALQFKVNAAERMRIDSSGNVGIGTSSPTQAKLDILLESNYASHTGHGLSINSNSSNAYTSLYIGTDDTVDAAYIQTAGRNTSFTTKDLLIQPNGGKVGIGTSSPDTTLHLSSTSPQITLTDTNATGFSKVSGSGGNIYIQADEGDDVANSKIDMRVDGSTRLLIDSSGNVHVHRASNDNSIVGVTVEAGRINLAKAGGNVLGFYRSDTNSLVGSVTVNTSSTSYNTSSDYRLKTNVLPMTGATDTFKLLKPVNFEWIADGTRVDGFLAHELQEVIPAAATGTKDAMRDEEYEVTAAIEATFDEEGEELTAAVDAVMDTRSVPDMQGIDQSKVVPLLTAALQEAIATIESMEARLQALETAP